MNRRSFFKLLAAVPVATIASKKILTLKPSGIPPIAKAKFHASNYGMHPWWRDTLYPMHTIKTWRHDYIMRREDA